MMFNIHMVKPEIIVVTSYVLISAFKWVQIMMFLVD